MDKKLLISEINSHIDNDYMTTEFEFDKDITINVEDYKTEWSNGYTMTLQTIRVADYLINCHHFDGEKLVEKCELLRDSIDTIGIKETIEKYTVGDSWDEKSREWKER